MKKLITLVLSIILISSCCLFSSCKKEPDKDITKLYASYLAIADSASNLTSIETSNPQILKIDFIYSDNLNSKISNNSTAYSYIESFYNQMLEDAILPTLQYSSMLSQENTTKSERLELFNKLEVVKSNYIETAKRLKDLENALSTSTTNEILIKLFNSYAPLIDSAVSLSMQISDIYFNKIAINSNPSYLNLNINNVNLEQIALNAKNKLLLYKTIYVDVFLNTKIHNYDIPQKIVENPTTFAISYTPYTTLKNSNFNQEISANLEEKREELVQLANNLHLIENELWKEYKNYRTSLSKIEYAKINERSSLEELGYKQLVDQFCYEGGIAYKSFYCINKILTSCYN